MFYIPKAKGAWLIMLLAGLFLVGVYEFVFVKASEKEVTFEKVHEESYDALIRDIAFGFVVKDGEEQIYCKAIVLEDKEVQILDENGRVVFRKPLVYREYIESDKFRGSTAILSKRGNFVAIHDYIGKSGDPIDYFVEEEYTICNDKGEEIYRIKGPVEGTGMQDRLLISDKDGSAVGTRIEYGALDFYRPNGEVKTVSLFGELGWGRRMGYVAFSGDGEYLGVLVREVAEPSGGKPSLKADISVMLFDNSGNELWRRKVSEYQLDIFQLEKIAISEHGEFLFFKAFTSEGETAPMKGEHRDLTSVTLSLYDWEGNDMSFKDTSLFCFESFCFSRQSDFVALGGRNLIRLMRTRDGSIVFEKELPNDVGIRELRFSGDGEYLMVRAKAPIGVEKVTKRHSIPGREYRTVYTNRVFVFDMRGTQVWQEDFPELKGIFSENGYLAFSSRNKYEIFKRIKGD